MSLTPGSTVGRYQVRELIGSGGMGDVYKAFDPTLGRSVALKVLKAGLSADTDRVTRFLMEARAASALNHPNILTIHEVGDHESSRFIVSEFVEGDTLRDRLARGPLTLREILDVAIQTASALSAAHAAGIVHRDIKPENLMLRRDGYVKVLDFGVAKLAQPAPSAGAEDLGVTIAADTGAGMVVGTMAYMSPEQARGLEVDGRSDSFSLGIVLYELVTGRPPFTGATASDILVAVLDREPPPLRLHARGLPPQLEWIIAKALDKDPALRYQSMADFRVDLMRLKAAIESGRAFDTGVAMAGPALPEQPIAVELTDDSPQVLAIGRVSRVTPVLAVVAAAAIVAAAFAYNSVRVGADLPLQVPRGAVLTKAREVVTALGVVSPPSRQAVEFDDTLSIERVIALDGLAAVRDAVRAGAVAEWGVGFSAARDPRGVIGGDDALREGEVSVSIDPTGKVTRFASGVSQQPVAPPDRDRATALATDIVRRQLGVDVSGYELEFVQRAFPAGMVELTWRSPTRQFGHIEQVRAHFQGERLVRLARSLEPPPGYTEPPKPLLNRILGPVTGTIIGGAFVAGWAFGIFWLVRTRDWDALKERLPLGLSALIMVAMAVSVLETSRDWQGALGVALVMLFLTGTLVPAMSGMFLWLRRQAAVRLWAAQQVVRGAANNTAVAISLMEGALAGALLAALPVAADAAGIRIPGFVPSLSREVNAVDAAMIREVMNTMMAASFVAVGIAFVVEALDWFRLRPVTAMAIVTLAGAVLGGGAHQSLLALGPPAAAQALFVLLLVLIYRTRGFLAAWIAFAVSEVLLDAMAARSLDDPDLASRSTLLWLIAAAPLVAGGIILLMNRRRQSQPAAPAAA